MPLTDVVVRAATPQSRTRRLFDGRGLYLEISPSGGRWWRWKYRVGGKEKAAFTGSLPGCQSESGPRATGGGPPAVGCRHRPWTGPQGAEARAHRRRQLRGYRSGVAREVLGGVGAPATAVASCAAWSTTCFPGWVSGPSRISGHRNCSGCCAGSRAAAPWRRPTAPCRTAGRFSGTPSPPAGRRAIRPAIFAAPCLRPRNGTSPRSSNRSALVPCCGRSTRTRGSS